MRYFNKRQWPLLGLGILLGWVAFYIISFDKEAIRESLIEDIIPEKGLRFHDFRYDQNNPEKGVTWALDAKEMRTSGDKNFFTFKEFRMKVAPKDKPFLELSGAEGNYSRNSGEINLWGNLEGVTGDGYKIFTEQVLINEKNGRITTDKPVKIFGSFFSVHGRGLIVDVEKEIVRILSDVTAEINKETLI